MACVRTVGVEGPSFALGGGSGLCCGFRGCVSLSALTECSCAAVVVVGPVLVVALLPLHEV